ncbi:MAG: hypothetical protein JOZ69_21615 [Myxococcales bacterium]|nr:hypothetical protein [Myxococcales bacterium]
MPIAYTAPPSCPSASDFATHMRARLQTPPGSGPAATDPRRSLDVHIASGNGAEYVGRVWLTRGDRRSATRTLTGHDCGDVVDALALIAALAVRSDVPTEADAPPAPAPPPAAQAVTSAGPRDPVDPAVLVAPAARGEVPAGAAPVRDEGGGHVEAGGLVAVGPAPAAIIGGTLGAGWAWAPRGYFAPAVALSFGAGGSPSIVEAGGTATFSWFVVHGDACMLRARVGGVLRVRACVGADGGVLRAAGRDTVSPETSSRGWLSVGASTRLELPVGDRFGAHVMAGVEAPLRRDRFAFGDHDFFVVPFVVAVASASAAAYFR